MPRTPKPTDHMDSVRHLMGTMPDHEIAALCNSTPSIVGRYRRRYGIPAYEGYKFGMGQTPPSKRGREDGEEPEAEATETVAEPVVETAPVAEAPAESKPKSRSKLDAFKDLIGTVTDAEVAAMAGVTAEAVRIYRRRHGMSSRREVQARAEAVAQATVAPVAVVEVAPAADETASDADSSKKSPQRRSSKLDSYMDLVGTLPDREVATMAGVTPENVRAFRRRHNIPARWRDEGDEGRVSEAPAAEIVETVETVEVAVEVAETPAVHVVDSAPAETAPTAPVVEVPAPQATGTLHGYAVHVHTGGGTLEYLIVSTDIASAATGAMRALASRHSDAEVTSIRHLGPALA